MIARPTRALGRAAPALLLAFGLSCSLVRPVDDLEVSSGSQSLPADGTPAADSAACERDAECTREQGRCLEDQHFCQLCPDEMQQVSFGDGLAFCIDRFETTQGEYNQFLSELGEQPAFELQDPELCPATESFEPGGGADCLSSYDRGGDPELPIVCVDLCDAMAYCHSRGKRLCGGRHGVKLDRTPDTVNKPNDDEWMAACMGGNGSKYPYGDTYEQGRCNITSPRIEPAAAFRDCETPNHIRHLSGNVAEWVLVCNDNRDFDVLRCLVRGGEFETTDPELASCTHIEANAGGNRFPRRALEPADLTPGVGIRCCMD